MTWTIACGDVVPGCPAVVRGETEDAVLAQVAQHAAADHGLTDIDEQTLAAVRGAMRQEA